MKGYNIETQTDKQIEKEQGSAVATEFAGGPHPQKSRHVAKNIYLKYFASEKLQKKVKIFAIANLVLSALLALGSFVFMLEEFFDLALGFLGRSIFLMVGIIGYLSFLINKGVGSAVVGRIFQVLMALALYPGFVLLSLYMMIWGICILREVSKEYRSFLHGKGQVLPRSEQKETPGEPSLKITEERSPEDIIYHMEEKKKAIKQNVFLKGFAPKKLRKWVWIYAIGSCICSILTALIFTRDVNEVMGKIVPLFIEVMNDKDATGIELFFKIMFLVLFSSLTFSWIYGWVLHVMGLVFQILFLFMKRPGFAITGMAFHVYSVILFSLSMYEIGLPDVIAAMLYLSTILWGVYILNRVKKEYVDFLYRP